MSITSVFPTLTAPIVVAYKNARNQLSAKKFWRIAPNSTPYNRTEEIWASSCIFSKTHSFQEEDFVWTPPKCITPKNTGIVAVQYNRVLNTVQIRSIANITKFANAKSLPEPIENYKRFALNPEHQFSLEQSQAIYMQLRSWFAPEVMLEFVAMHSTNSTNPANPTNPNPTNSTNSTNSTNPNPNPNQTNQTNQSNQSQPSYPSTVLEAFKLVSNEALKNVAYEEPNLKFVAQPITHSYSIPSIRPTNYRSMHVAPMGTYNVILKVTPEGKHNARREVFYANDFPMSPLKSTVAILYIDINPKSATFNQPTIECLNLAKSSQQDILTFYNNHKFVMSQEQLSQFPHSCGTAPNLVNNLAICAECGSEFTPTRITSRFCSEPCRVAYYSKGRRKSRDTQPATQDSISREEFQALQAQMAQLLQLLTKTDKD